MTEPSPLRKIIYLGGYRAKPEYHDWLKSMINVENPRKLGALLALPNALVMVIFGLLGLAIGDLEYAAILLGGSLVILSTGALVPAMTRMRVKQIVRKNKF